MSCIVKKNRVVLLLAYNTFEISQPHSNFQHVILLTCYMYFQHVILRTCYMVFVNFISQLFFFKFISDVSSFYWYFVYIFKEFIQTNNDYCEFIVNFMTTSQI